MTKLDLTIGDVKVSWEHPSDDLTASEVLTAFMGVLVTHTYMPQSILDSMAEIVGEATTAYVNQ